MSELRETVSQMIAYCVWNCGNDCTTHGEDAYLAANVAIQSILDALIDDAIATVPALTIDPHGGTLKNYVVGYLDSHKEPTP